MPDPAVEAVARAAGAAALPAFGVGLVATQAAVLAAWAGRQRLGHRSSEGAVSPTRRGFAIGIAAVVVAVAVLAALAACLVAGAPLDRFDPAFSDAVAAALAAPALGAFALLTHLGDRATQWAIGIVVAALLLARRRPALAVAWIAAVAGNGTLNTVLKQVFERARPERVGPGVEAGFSFPSGHSSGAVAVYGMLAYLALRLLPSRWHLPSLLLAAAAVWTTGCSRVFLKVHYLSDVAAGFASGSAWVGVCILGAEAWRRRINAA